MIIRTCGTMTTKRPFLLLVLLAVLLATATTTTAAACSMIGGLLFRATRGRPVRQELRLRRAAASDAVVADDAHH